MLEIPEALNLSKQLECIFGKKIVSVTAAYSPSKFAWYSGDPRKYPSLLNNRIITSADAIGGMVRVYMKDIVVVFSDGVNLIYIKSKEKTPDKHQLLFVFDDNTALCATIQMYGGLLCAKEKEIDNKYYLVTKEKPSPLSKDFNEAYFNKIISDPELQKLSVKALLATEQRIPGLGNGVLQDILFNAHVHPRKKVGTLSAGEKETIFKAIKSTLLYMVKNGGRDTEKDLFGNYGKYKTICSKNTAGKPCPECGSIIQKASYMGGSVYYCDNCQRL